MSGQEASALVPWAWWVVTLVSKKKFRLWQSPFGKAGQGEIGRCWNCPAIH